MKENITLFLCKEKSLTFEAKMQPVARLEQIGQNSRVFLSLSWKILHSKET